MNADHLKHIYLFNGASAEDLQALATHCESKEVLAGDFLFRSGENADAFYYVERGTFDLLKPDSQTVIASLGAEQCLGAMAFFDSGPRGGSALSRESGKILKVPYPALKKIMDERPAFALLVYQNETRFLTKTLRNLSKEIEHRYF